MLRFTLKKLQNGLLPQAVAILKHHISTTPTMTHNNAATSSNWEHDDDDKDCDPTPSPSLASIQVLNIDTSDERFVYENPPSSRNCININDRNGVPLAPIDVDPWVDMEAAKQGTVDVEAIERERRFTLPPIPKERNQVYQAKGIKVMLPKRLLRPETYRYRLDAEDAKKPDDIRFCIFEK